MSTPLQRDAFWFELLDLNDESLDKDERPLPPDIVEQAFPADNDDDFQEAFLKESISAAFGLSRGGRHRKPLDEAWEWALSSDKTNPFGFYQCCLAAQVDPEAFLELLRFQRRRFHKE